jgi:hypothetical protein
MEKGKRKRIGVPVRRSYLYLLLSHRHAILSRGTQQNRQKLSECSNPLEIILFPTVSVSLDISDQVGLFHRIPEARTYPTPGRIYLTSQIYLASIGFQSRGSYSGWTYPTPGWIYLTYWIYSSLTGFQYRVTTFDRKYLSPIRYIRPSRC